MSDLHFASSRRRRTGFTALLLSALPCAAAELDSAELVARLARPPPASIAFTEIRLSPLLSEPLVVRGTLEYADSETLGRHVESPYRENTSIGADSVRVERPGEAVRTYALRRAPELRAFAAGMTSLLRGDSSRLAEHFSVVLAGDDEHWRIELVPTNSQLRDRLERVVVVGSGADAKCYAIRDVGGGASVMLLGTAATRALPQPATLPALLEQCDEE